MLSHFKKVHVQETFMLASTQEVEEQRQEAVTAALLNTTALYFVDDVLIPC